MKIEIKNMFNEEVIFAHEQENNSIKLTAELAVSKKISLCGANLSDTNLSNANLSNANLSNANLSNANLSNANLSNANLFGTNLSNANLSNVIGNMEIIFSMQLDTWRIAFTKEKLSIGCETHLITDWFDFSDDRIRKMDSKALDWWEKWKAPLKTIIDTTLGNNNE